MVGVNFFFDLFSHSGLRAFFTSDFANCTTAPALYAQPSGAVHSIWWLGLIFFLTSSPILDLGHFSQVILPIVLLICPNYQLLFTASDGWGFFLTSSQILDLGHFSQIILPIVLQTKITPTIRCCEQHLMVGVNFFFDLFSHSGLRAFFTSDFANCTTDYAPTIIRCCSQHLMVGVNFFFDLFSHSGLRAFFTNDFANCTTDYMPNHQVLFTASDGWG